MIEQPDNFDPSDTLGRYARGELGAAQIDELTHQVNSDPELRSAWTEYQISRYIDGELTPHEVTELTDRVQDDPKLTEAMAEYQALDAKLTQLADDVPEFDFLVQREEILTAIERRRADRRRRMQRWVLRPALATLAAAAVLVLAFGVYLMVRTEGPSPAGEFQITVLPPAQTPPVTGEVEVTVLPGKAEGVSTPGGSVVAVAGGPVPEAVAQGMSSYMMLACCAGMPPQPLPSASFSPLFQQAWACISWFLEKEHRDQLKAKHEEL